MTPEQLQAIEPMTRAELEARGWKYTYNDYYYDPPGNIYGLRDHPLRFVDIEHHDDTEARRATTVLSILWGLV